MFGWYKFCNLCLGKQKGLAFLLLSPFQASIRKSKSCIPKYMLKKMKIKDIWKDFSFVYGITL